MQLFPKIKCTYLRFEKRARQKNDARMEKKGSTERALKILLTGKKNGGNRNSDKAIKDCNITAFGLLCYLQQGKFRVIFMKRKRMNGCLRQIGTIVLMLLSYSFYSPVWGLDPGKRVDQYLTDRWTAADGLPSNIIVLIRQTPDGYLWIAASKGLARFDGRAFSVNPFGDDTLKHLLEAVSLTSLLVDSHGVLWAGHSEGLVSYDYKTGAFRVYNKNDGLIEPHIRHIKEDMRGNLWISAWEGPVYRFDNGKFKVFGPSDGLVKGNKISSIVETQKGTLLFATRENGIFQYQGDKFLEYPVRGLAGHIINFMMEDKKGDLWIGTTTGLFRVTEEGTTIFTTTQGLSHDNVMNILEDGDGNLWVGTQHGLNRFKKKQNGENEIDTLLPEVLISCLFEDREKNLWVGLYDVGMGRIKDGTFITYSPIPALREEVLMSVYEDSDGDAWIGGVDGKLYHCRGEDFIETIIYPELSGAGISAIVEDTGGNLWLGTNGRGAFRMQKKKGTPPRIARYTTAQGLAHDTVTSITRDSRGDLWFGTYNGVSVYRYPDGPFETFSPGDGLVGKIVYNVYEDRAHNILTASDEGLTFLTKVFAGGQGGPSARGTYKELQKEPPLSPITISPKAILTGVPVTCVHEDVLAAKEEAPVYWIATQGQGLVRYSHPGRGAGKMTFYTTKNGLASNSLFQFFEDRHGYFWLMSDYGILRLDKSQLERYARGEADGIYCISYGETDGLRSYEFNNRLSRHSALQTKNGDLWFITAKGISIVKPDRVRVDRTPPPVLIEAVYFNGREVNRDVKGGGPVFKGAGDMRFRYTAPTFVSPEKIRFKYRLEGGEGGWVVLPPGAERAVAFQNLEPGAYTFTVTACNAEGVWNPEGESFSFVIKPFFYQTLGFKGAVILLLVFLGAVGVYLYKVRPFGKKKKQQGLTMEPQFAEVCIERLKHLMENEKIYCEPELTLQGLAEKLSIQPYQLSQLLNERLRQSFSDYINSSRVEEAKRLLAGSKGQEMKNTSIAFDVGFNSMTAFYKAFKKYTGMTPNQFKKGN